MKPSLHTVEHVQHKKNIAKYLFDLSDLTTGGASWEQNNALIFLDTNILLWLYRINGDARAEIINLLEYLKKNDRLRIPAWVIHEYNRHITKREDTVFFPFKKATKEIEGRLKILEQHSKLVVDDAYLKGSRYDSKSSFLAELKNSTDSLRSLLKALNSSSNKNLDEIQSQINELIDGCVLTSDLNDLLLKSSQVAAFRNQSRVPPGFQDNDKQSNQYGDYIFWQEILIECKTSSKNALIITNDRKPDWVYSPHKIIDIDGSTKPNNGKATIKLDLLLPFLEYEFNAAVGPESEAYLCNIELLSHLCSSEQYNPKDHSSFQKLAEAVSVATNKKDDTYLVISWFLNNREKYSQCMKGAAYWEYSPDQINHDNLKDYIQTNIPDINIEKVDITEVICELFI